MKYPVTILIIFLATLLILFCGDVKAGYWGVEIEIEETTYECG